MSDAMLLPVVTGGSILWLVVYIAETIYIAFTTSEKDNKLQ